jgi:hypothetical protein
MQNEEHTQTRTQIDWSLVTMAATLVLAFMFLIVAL